MAEETRDVPVNFCFPIRDLENDRVKLTPLNPSIHGDAYWAGTHAHPDVYTFLPFGPFPSLAAFLTYIDERWQQSAEYVLWAMLDKASGAFAGICGYINTSAANLSTEIGAVICLPAFQSKGITSAAVALLMQYALLLPSEGGLGLRRVQWQAHASNERSIGLARKHCFQLEGIIRWQRVLSGDKPGVDPREGDSKPGTKGRHTALLSVCWDDWEQGVKEKIYRPGLMMYAA
ncbi:acyl-CoA N-acyltransferase [Polyporus arcularius HHB13444]|uniref:Acyl-CoA N-acyltransferase n=1 Tax=Polyporus arcularius HHB13444 TaxID=1314778 RepID=A0A5C3NP14_9APHY|nr:acyl-CoA N-acyltransferase [Polyporus arcularius HHB13444]